MRFAWSRAVADEAAEEAVPAAGREAAADGQLVGVELLTTTGRQVGWIGVGSQRTSDWLNARHPTVPVVGLTAGEEATLPPSPPISGDATDLAAADIVWVVPPPLPPNRHLRLHRRRLLVHLELDGWDIAGQVHVRPGAEAVDQVLRGTRELVPLTEVHVVSRQQPGVGFSQPVLIVNRSHVRRVVEDARRVGSRDAGPIGPSAPATELDPRIALLVPQRTAADDPASDPATPSATEEPTAHDEPSATEMLTSAVTLLLDAGIIGVAEFQGIRSRIEEAGRAAHRR